MKKIILIFNTILFFNTLANAQNVGIGSSSFSPLNMLDVKGRMVIGTGYAGISTAPADGLLIQGNTGIGTASPRGVFDVFTDGNIYLSNSTTSGTAQSLFLPGHIFIAPYNGSNISYLQARRSDNSGTTEFQFRTYNAGSLNEAVRINGLGNVGIGTTNPGFKLDVNGIVRVPSGNYYSFENWQWAIGKDMSTQFSTNEELQLMGYGSSGNSFQIIGVSGVSPTYTYTRILQANFDNGRVGIGTNPTNSLLEVNGGIRILTSPSGDLYGSGLILNDESNASLWHQIHIHGNRIRAYDGSTEDVYVTTADINSSINGTVNYVAKFTSANGIGSSQIFDNGTNVGIGTAAPAKKLEVNGDIYNRGILFQKTSDGQGSGAHGISWYDPSFFTWFDYMAPAGGTNSPSATAAPTDAASGVTSWARRFNIENVAGYGWLFESGTNASGSAPTVKFAINSSNGNFHSVGNAIVDGTVRAGAYAILGTNISAGYYQDATNGAYRAIVGAGTTNGYYFQTNAGAATTLYVGLGGTYNGRVGIGTTTPGYSLHVPSGYIGTDYINTTDNSVGSGVTGVMVKAGDNYHRTATAAALATFLGNYGNWIPNNGIGDWQIASSSTGTSYNLASLELRESNFTGNGSATPPRLGFHWGGIVASQIGIESSGRIAILNNPGTGYENLVANYMYFGNYIFGNDKYVVDATDSWLRLNQQGSFANGIYSPGFFRVDGGIASGGIGGLGGGTVHASGTIRGAGFQDYSTGNQVIDAGGGWHRSYGQAGFYNGTYGGGIWMNDATWVRVYNDKNFYTHSTQSDYNAIFGEKYYNVSGGGYYDAASGVHGYYNNPGYGDGYRYGVWGQFNHTYNGLYYGWRAGGVLGTYQDAGGGRGFGVLAYNNSSGTFYGVYGSTGYGSGGGFLPSGELNSIGGGFYGGMLGGWTRGEIIGNISMGEVIASYNLGDEYTSGHQIELVTTEDKKVPAYTVTSTEVVIYKSGRGKLVNGIVQIIFDEDYNNILSKEELPIVTVTPIGDCKGLHINSIDHNGFTVAENQAGTSNVEFMWISVGKRIDSQISKLPDEITNSNFDRNLKGVMFNESNTEQSATPIWWDGAKIRFDQVNKGIKIKPVGGNGTSGPNPAEESLSKQKKYTEIKPAIDPSLKGNYVPVKVTEKPIENSTYN